MAARSSEMVGDGGAAMAACRGRWGRIANGEMLALGMQILMMMMMMLMAAMAMMMLKLC